MSLPPPLLPAFSAPVNRQRQQQQQQTPSKLQLPLPLLHMKQDVTDGGITAKRFTFKPAGGSSSGSSRSTSFAGSRASSGGGSRLCRSSGGGNFDAAVAAAVKAVSSSVTLSSAPAVRVPMSSCTAGSSSSSSHAATALNSLLYTSSNSISVSPAGVPTRRCSTDHDGGSSMLTDTDHKSTTGQLCAAALPQQLPPGTTAGGAEIKRFTFDRAQLPASGFRSDTAHNGCHELCSPLPAGADATAGVAASAAARAALSRPGPPRSNSARLEPEPLLRIPSGEPQAPPVLVSAFATEAMRRMSFEDAGIDAKISAAANAAARLAARAASSGGAIPPSWRGLPTCPGAAAARSASGGLERSCRDPSSADSSGGCSLHAQRAASLPPPGPGDQEPSLNPASAGARPSASVDAFAAAASAASCSRSGSAGASRLGLQPSGSPLVAACSRTSSDLADELAAELGLLPAAGSSSGSGFRRAAGAAFLGVALIDASLAGWRLLYINEVFASATGVPAAAGSAFWQHFELPTAEV